MSTFRFHRSTVRLFAVACMMILGFALHAPVYSHDFGGGTGPGGPPPGDGCPGCCGGGGGGGPCGPGGPGCGSSGNPVNFWDGSERHSTTDFSVPGYMPIAFTRIYDSRVDYDSPLGYGWSHNFDVRVLRYPDGTVMLRRDCGGRRLFTPSGGAYISPAGEFNNMLEDNPDGTVSLIEASGLEFKFDLRGRLESMTNPSGHRLEFEYDPGGRLPLLGVSRYSPNPETLGIIALDYRLTRILERDSLGAVTGRELTLAYDGASGRLQSVSDHTSRSWTYSHDAKGNLISASGPVGLVYTYSYDDATDPHNLTGLDEGTVQFTLTYDTEDRVIRQALVSGTVLDIDYTMPGLQTTVTRTVTDNLGAPLQTGVTVYEFNSFGNPTKIVDALGNELSYVRDGEGNTTTKEIRENRPGVGLVLILTQTFTYDANGNMMQEVLTQISTGEVLTKDYTHDGNQVATERVVSSLDPTFVTGFDRVWAHNARGFPTVVTQEKWVVSSGETPTFFTLDYGYDAYDQMTTTTYPNGDVETNTYAGGYLSGRGGDSITHDLRGNTLTRTDRNGKIWNYDHDDLNRMTEVEDPTGSKTLLAYTGRILTNVETGRVGTTPGVIAIITRDAMGRATKVERQTPSGPVVTRMTDYDSDGRAIRVVDAAGRETLTTYDKLGRVLTVTDNGSNVTRYEYDALGNVTKITDPANRETVFTNSLVHAQSKPLDITNGLNKTYSAVLDAAGHLRTLTDPKSGVLGEVHDGMGRLTSFSTPSGTTTTFAYDGRGRLGSRTDPGIGVTSYSYNSRGGLTGVDYPGPDAVTFTLDAADQILRAVDADSDLSFTYDEVGRPTREQNNLSGHGIDSTYGSIGQRLTTVTSDGVAVTYEYDALGFVSGIRRNGTLEVSYVRDLSGLTTSMTYANGIVATFVRDAVGNVDVQESRDSTNALVSRVDYTRDPSGVIALKHEIIRRPDDTLSELFFHYTYDDGLRLTREEIREADNSTILSARTFTYDDVGNRLTMAVDGGPATTYTYGTDYQLSSETTGGSSISYTYDPRGNLLTETAGPSTVTYSYDAEGRVVGLVSPTHTASYVLSYDGRRLAKIVNGVRTDYLNDGSNPVAEYPQGGNAVSYLAGLGLDRWFLRAEAADKSYFLQIDDLRSVMQLTGPTGDVQNSYVYQAFGELLESVVNEPNARTFTGRTTDEETSHLYFRERLYSQRTGRFLSLDPYRPDASRSMRIGGTQRVALLDSGIQPSPLFDQRRDVLVTGMDVTGYLYVGNNPINATDPTGEVLLWNPASGSVTSFCGGSGCVISGCGGSGCLGSGCGGSGCLGSGCAGSGCFGSACGTSVCGGSLCAVSGCAGSGCAASACIGSACNVSLCAGSACVVSFCAGSLCVGSGCYGSACAGTACVGSVCGGSACGGSACLNSTCAGSVCISSTCGGSVCYGSTCGVSGCSTSGCSCPPCP